MPNFYSLPEGEFKLSADEKEQFSALFFQLASSREWTRNQLDRVLVTQSDVVRWVNRNTPGATEYREWMAAMEEQVLSCV